MFAWMCVCLIYVVYLINKLARLKLLPGFICLCWCCICDCFFLLLCIVIIVVGLRAAVCVVVVVVIVVFIVVVYKCFQPPFSMCVVAYSALFVSFSRCRRNRYETQRGTSISRFAFHFFGFLTEPLQEQGLLGRHNNKGAVGPGLILPNMKPS